MTETLLKIDDLPELDMQAFATDPGATLAPLRPHKIVRSVRGFEVIDYDLVYSLFADQRLRPMSAADFSSHGASPYIADFIDKGIFLFMEPDRHRAIRKIFSRGFAGRQIKDHQAVIYEIGNNLIDRILTKDEADLVHDYTERFSSEVLSRLLGFPTEDIPAFVDAALELRHLVFVPMQPHVPRIEAALDILRAYATDLLDKRRSEPQNDFLSSLIEAERTEGKLTTDEVVWGSVNLLLGGIDTTNFQIASTLMHLIANDAWELAAADESIRAVAIEEAMRLTPVSTMLSRVVHETLEVEGVELPVGADVRLNLVGAGRDPAKFEDPQSYRLDRVPPYFPAIFGNGIHQCIGRPLALPELKIGTELITQRLTDVRFATEPALHPWTDAIRGPKSMRISYRARNAA